MPRFVYIARDKTGNKVTGTEESPSQDELIAWLQAKNLVVTNVQLESKVVTKEVKKQRSKTKLKRGHSRITGNDLTLFCRQLATLLAAGVSILEALAIILKQVTSRQFYDVLNDLRRSMEAGLSLHEAMAKKPRVFSPLWVNLVESGEASGNLAVVLSRLASFLERNMQFRAKIVSALIYPIILMVVGIGALFFLTVKIIPTFANLFSSFNMQLPVITQILISVSNFIRRYMLFIIIAAVVMVFIIRGYIKHPQGRRKYESLLFNLPVFGSFFHNLIIERFSSGMSTLIESGVPILYALEISERSVSNLIMADIVHKVKEDVRQGHTLSMTMEKSAFFEPMIIQMVRIGEEIGDLSGMFKKIHAFYQEYVETFLGRFTAMFEPIMLVFIGGIIGIMVIGMFLPIFQISQLGMN
ncbi:MAG: type II secretion system F family protein [Candidatus Omnitrophota bacterium]|jgi:type IV pilus assembly protein PilC